MLMLIVYHVYRGVLLRDLLSLGFRGGGGEEAMGGWISVCGCYEIVERTGC